MSRQSGLPSLPEIIMGESEYEKLSELAEAAVRRSPEVATSLLLELERATVVEMQKLPPDVVRLGSKLTYRADDGQAQQVCLVLPAEADISAGKVSVLTPIGTALIGLSAGQSITWAGRDGQPHRLEVLAVEQPAPSEA